VTVADRDAQLDLGEPTGAHVPDEQAVRRHVVPGDAAGAADERDAGPVGRPRPAPPRTRARNASAGATGRLPRGPSPGRTGSGASTCTGPSSRPGADRAAGRPASWGRGSCAPVPSASITVKMRLPCGRTR
jgi:hypothetical protein